jgi:hypothetical protein
MEALKPLVVLVLFGTILYGAYSVVQKGPTPPVEATAAVDAPPFAAPPAAPPVAPPQVELTPAVPVPPPPAAVAVVAPPVASPVATVPPPASTVPPPPMTPPPAALPPPAPVAPPDAFAAPIAAAAGAAAGAAVASADPSPTYLAPQSAPPPAATDPATRPDRYAALAPAGAAVAAPVPPSVPAPDPRSGSASSAAFAAAWAEAHTNLAAGRYAEALAGLSVWYDDPVLGLEESQRLEDLLGQLAGTVIYSQQDLLLAPHVVAPHETLDQIAAPLGVSPLLLAKINGIDDPAQLVPGEHLKVIRGPFDAVVSISRRRLSLQLAGNYAGSFPVLVGRQFLGRVGGSLPVTEVAREGAAGTASLRRSIVLADGMVIEAVDDPAVVSDNVPPSSLVVAVRDLDDLLDILGPGSRVLVRQ